MCIPENGRGSSMTSTSSCICVILPEFFVASLAYDLALQTNGTVLWNGTVIPITIVKPRSPINLTIDKGENDSFYVVRWLENYREGDMLYGEQVTYEIKYWNKHNPEEIFVEQLLNQRRTKFEILAMQLRRGCDYLVSVRCCYGSYDSKWSEWSDVAEFHNDYGIAVEDSLQKIVPISCMLITALIVICYFCFTKVKREWWDQIPNPAKSHLVVKNVKAAQFSVWKKMLSIDEIKAPFHDMKQTRMENQLYCKNCLTLMGKDNVTCGEKPCSCLNKCGKQFPEEHEVVLIPEVILVEDSVEVCEYSTNIEKDSHEDDPAWIPMCLPCEISTNSFIEPTQHNDALADMFIKLLECGTKVHDAETPDCFTEEHKDIENCESTNSSQQAPKENVFQVWQSCDTSHACSFSTTASQDDYSCGAASTKSMQSEESFESGYQSSNTDSASPKEKNPPDMLHQNHFLCSSGTQHDWLVLIKKSPNAPFSEIIKDGINSTGYKSFDSLMPQSMESCSLAYKSFDNLLAQSTAYQSFSSLMSQSMINNNLTQCLENPGSSLSLTEFSENQILPCGEEQAHLSLGNQSCCTNHEADCTEPACQTTCSGDINFPCFSFHTHERVSFLQPEKELHKVTCQNVPEKATAISFPTGSNPSTYQPFDIALTHCDNNNVAICDSPYKPFINLLNSSLKEALPAVTVSESDLEIDL
ncbi:interleukin-4 receptor subunit alpha isoform X2 [Carettochelys insculpta]